MGDLLEGRKEGTLVEEAVVEELDETGDADVEVAIGLVFHSGVELLLSGPS